MSANDREKGKGETERQPDIEKKIKSKGERQTDRQTGRGERQTDWETERDTQRGRECVQMREKGRDRVSQRH